MVFGFSYIFSYLNLFGYTVLYAVFGFGRFCLRFWMNFSSVLRFLVHPNAPLVKVEWYPIYGPKSLFKFGEKRPMVCCCTHEQKMNFEGFTQNGCYGNQSQPLEVLFDSTDANNPCPLTKQDLIFKQAYLVGFCFVLFNKLKF